MNAQYTQWTRRWQAALDACQRKGGEVSGLVIMPPASEEAVADVESEIGAALPTSFRRVLLEFSAHAELHWLLSNEDIETPVEADWPSELNVIFGGGPFWDLDRVVQYEKRRISWVENVFSDPEDSYDSVWYNKLVFDKVANGDIIAFDLEFMPDPSVVYLSHEAGSGHGYRLGDNFVDFMERWSLLGCPGNDDCQMMPFLPDAVSGLNVNGDNARKWREWFGLDFEVNS